jgi:anti-sigma B factor antagonist
MAKALSIRARREPGYVIVTISGEVDIATVDRLRDRLSALADGGVPVVADLDQVSFIDATGLGALAGAARQAAAQGASLHVVCARSQTRRLFRVTGLDRQIPLARSLAEALRDLGSLDAGLLERGADQVGDVPDTALVGQGHHPARRRMVRPAELPAVDGVLGVVRRPGVQDLELGVAVLVGDHGDL